ADHDRQELLLTTIREKGIVVSRAMTSVLARADTTPYFRLGEELAQYQTETVSLKLLLRPAQPQNSGFVYVAPAPPADQEALEVERRHLIDAGILERIERSCDGNLPLAMRIELPEGRTELLTSVTPVKTQRGCWALVISSLVDSLGSR